MYIDTCGSAGTGRQAGLRSQCVTTCGFKSHLPHQTKKRVSLKLALFLYPKIEAVIFIYYENSIAFNKAYIDMTTLDLWYNLIIQKELVKLFVWR